MSESIEPQQSFGETAIELRVTYAEVDKMGRVYYANYLKWFEVGRAEFIRARGKSYKDLEESGLLMPVIEAYARYREPAVYDDMVEIRTGVASVDQVRCKFAYRIKRKLDEVLLVEGYTVHACMGPSGRARRFPEDLIRLLERSPLAL
jgi:acyl-CoA thioester hydrolase